MAFCGGWNRFSPAVVSLDDLRIGVAWTERADPGVRAAVEAVAGGFERVEVPWPDGTYPAFSREIVEVSNMFQQAHELGMATILWCYLRNKAFKVGSTDHHLSADLTGQANHLGVTLNADIIKQKLPEVNGGFKALNSGESSYGKLDERIYSELTTDHPIDLTRYQVINCYMGRCGLINSGGASGKNDFAEAVQTAVINKRAGGMGLISGRKAFQRPMAEGAKLLHTIQDVYLCKEVTVA